MCLAQLLNEISYTNTMYELSVKKYTLLDNGANEGINFSDEKLAQTSKYVEANEIVLPDVLGYPIDTYYASVKYLNHYAVAGTMYMGVVQGKKEDALKDLVDKYSTIPEVTTLGLPRLLLGEVGQPIRIDTATWIEDNYPDRFQIHFLGASSIWPKEPYYAAKYTPHVRSIDTSLPFNYGLAGVVLGDEARRVDRPKDYFTRWYEPTALTTIHTNLAIYKEWCNGKTTPSGQV